MDEESSWPQEPWEHVEPYEECGQKTPKLTHPQHTAATFPPKKNYLHF